MSLSLKKSIKFSGLLFIGVITFVILIESYVLLREDSAPSLKSSSYYAQGIIKIESIDYQTTAVVEGKPFSKFEGDVFGLIWHNPFSALEFFQPASRGRGIASGDFNNDGWQDILLGTSDGILLYKNLGGRFTLQNITLDNIPNLNFGVHVAAFVDIDNDGWQDIYLTTYGGRNYFLLNDTKDFKAPKMLEVPNTGAVLTSAVSFGDLDKDGDLDFVNGNWMPFRTQAGAEINKLLRNNDLEFVEENLQGVRGQTLSVLLADFTNDNNLDLIAGAEFKSPDNFYIGDGEGEFREIKKDDGIIPASPEFNMSIDIADFNNDLYMDIYMSGLSTWDTFANNLCPEIQNDREKQKCEKNIQVMNIIREGSLEKCRAFEEKSDKNECAIIFLLLHVNAPTKKAICDKIPQDYILQRSVCRGDITHQPSTMTADEYEENILQQSWQNILLEGSKNGIFRENTEEKNVHIGLNSWNAKFADLDNDEWQDIYVATGELLGIIKGGGSAFQPNIFFHNYKGQYFKVEQDEFGLEDLNIVPSYVYIDIDNDGDLDIITVPINGPLKIYVNNETKNNSIIFKFRDNVGNHFGIGNKIYIYYGENNERHQVREVKSGGGFLSFDAPIAHFGLGKYEAVTKIEIVWSTGEKTVIEKEFLANKSYVIAREH